MLFPFSVHLTFELILFMYFDLGAFTKISLIAPTLYADPFIEYIFLGTNE